MVEQLGGGRIDQSSRQQVYKVVNGREDLWGEYCRLRKEIKQLVTEKKLNV